MIAVRVVGALDAIFAWNGERLYSTDDFSSSAPLPLGLRGAAASVASETPASWRIVRDPLGINKLFWAPASEGVAVASRPKRLVEAGHPFDAIRAFPRGAVLDVGDGHDDGGIYQIELGTTSPTGAPLPQLARSLRAVLIRYLEALADAHREADFFVCLSGGLDSSGIAALARECFPQLTAVSFDLERPNGASDDRQIAERLARDLDLPLVRVTSSPASLLEKLDVVLEEGVDWRDFNVHAGLVNGAIAEAIGLEKSTRKIVLTGDLANEFLADYGSEQYRGTTFYELPRLRGPALRDALVRGLDTSNREVGVFAAWGVDVVQPYAVAVDFYLALPASLFESPEGKQDLGRELFGDRLPEYVYARPKVRAQVGSAEGDRGVLGLCIDHGVDARYLRDRFAELHGVESDKLRHFIRGGTYRAGIPTRLPVETS